MEKDIIEWLPFNSNDISYDESGSITRYILVKYRGKKVPAIMVVPYRKVFLIHGLDVTESINTYAELPK